MILEVAILKGLPEAAPATSLSKLKVKPGRGEEFEAAFVTASSIISSMPGYISHELQRCLEVENQYILLVRWMKLEDHTVGFRQSQQYQKWCQLLHHFYEPFPTVEHYIRIVTSHEST